MPIEMYLVYDKNAGADDLAIEAFFTEQAAQAKVVQLAEKGRDCAYKTFTEKARKQKEKLCSGVP